VKLVPYARPILTDYQSLSFRRECKKWAPRVSEICSTSKYFFRLSGEPWIRHSSRQRTRNVKQPPWTLKIYVCVAARHYWPVVMGLIDRFSSDNMSWKFFLAPKGFARPDKIVFYPRTRRELSRLVKKLAKEISKRSLHDLRHAALAEEFGLARIGLRGIYLGMDPAFLPMSWRMYRCICAACAERNVGYLQSLPGGRERWFRRMNLSTRHEGPATLRPSLRDIRYIQKYWKVITAGYFPG
jgi:hypothetical protein